MRRRMKPGGGAIKDCVKAHFSDLSADCQVAIIRAAAVGKACKADVKQFCADVKPGKGTVGGVHEVACGRPQRRLQGGDGQNCRKIVALRLARSSGLPIAARGELTGEICVEMANMHLG